MKEFVRNRVNKLVNVPIDLNDLKRKVDDSDVVDLNKLSNVVNNDVVKNTKFGPLNTIVNDLEK